MAPGTSLMSVSLRMPTGKRSGPASEMYCLSSAVSCTFVDVAGGGDRHTSGRDCRPVAVRDWCTTPSDHDTLIEVTSRHGDGRSFTLTPRAIRRCRAGLAALAAAFAATHVYHRCLICRRG